MKKGLKLLEIAAFLILLLISSGTSLAQNNNIYFVYDYAVFKGQENRSILEIYYSFYQRDLNYTFSDGKYSAAGGLEVKLYDKATNDVKFSEEYNVPSILADTSNGQLEKMIVGQLTYQLSPGSYKLEITGKDNAKTTGVQKYRQDILVENYSEKTSISDIELATSVIKSSDKENVFYKNTLEVMPNADGMFGFNINKLQYYFELYNLSSGDYTLVTAITNPNKDQVLFKNEKKINTNTSGRVEIGNFVLDSLPSSSYILLVTLTDNVSKLTINKEKKFFVRNKELTDDYSSLSTDDFLKSSYAAMKEELVNQDYEITIYLRDQKDNSTWNSLTTLDDKRRFLYGFWKKRDTNPVTPQNEFKIAYVKRVLEANSFIQEAFKEGWKTDRGRIYVLYGKPDDVESHPYESNTKSYEIWKYDKVEGGSLVVFVETQSSGSGIFTQVHSTIRGETRNDNWENDLTF